MKALAYVVVTAIVCCCSIDWVRGDSENAWPLPQVLPFLGGHRPSFYDIGGLAMLAIVASAIFGHAHGKSDESPDEEPEYEEVEAEEDDGDEDGDGGDDDTDDEVDDDSEEEEEEN